MWAQKLREGSMGMKTEENFVVHIEVYNHVDTITHVRLLRVRTTACMHVSILYNLYVFWC